MSSHFILSLSTKTAEKSSWRTILEPKMTNRSLREDWDDGVTETHLTLTEVLFKPFIAWLVPGKDPSLHFVCRYTSKYKVFILKCYSCSSQRSWPLVLYEPLVICRVPSLGSHFTCNTLLLLLFLSCTHAKSSTRRAAWSFPSDHPLTLCHQTEL